MRFAYLIYNIINPFSIIMVVYFSITIYSLVPRSFWNSGESLYSSLSTEFMSSFNVILPLSY